MYNNKRGSDALRGIARKREERVMDYVRVVLDVVLALIAAGGLRAMLEKRKYKQEVKRGDLENIQLAVEILMKNIVKPLKLEIYELRKEIGQLREALQLAKGCRFSFECPVLDRLQGAAFGEKCGREQSRDEDGEG